VSVTLGTLLSRARQLLHPAGRERFQKVRAALVEYCAMRNLAQVPLRCEAEDCDVPAYDRGGGLCQSTCVIIQRPFSRPRRR
jgi:hypothetical protein